MTLKGQGGFTLEQRFKAAYVVDEAGCWRWQYKARLDGYGRIKIAGRSMLAHRVAYELFVGAIPDGMEVDHLCRVRDCVNPDHLEAVTRTENMHRSPYVGAKVRQTACIHGHPFTPENTTIRPNGTRMCIACNRRRAREQKMMVYLDRAKVI